VANAQIDTSGFSRRVFSEHEKAIINHCNATINKKIGWRSAYSNKYLLDSAQIFLLEYLVRTGKSSISDSIEGNYSIFANGCRFGSKYLVTRGLYEGIDLNKKYGADNSTALMLAIKSNNKSLCDLILKKSTKINNINANGENEILLSVQYLKDTQLIAYLLAFNADLNQRNNWGLNVLEQAYYYSDPGIFHFLLHYCRKFGEPSFWAKSKLPEMAVVGGDTAIFNETIPLCDPDRLSENSFNYLDAAADFASLYYYSNIYRAGFYGDTSAASFKTKNMDINIFNTIIKNGYDINSTDSLNRNILFKCRGLDQVTTYLINQGININQIDSSGATVLKCYIDDIISPPVYEFGITKNSDRDYTSELEMVKFYIDHGANLGKNKGNGWTYLYRIAIQKNNVYLLKYLEGKYRSFIKID